MFMPFRHEPDAQCAPLRMSYDKQLDKSEFDYWEHRKKPPKLGALVVTRRQTNGLSVQQKGKRGTVPKSVPVPITARLPTPDPGSVAFSDRSNDSQGCLCPSTAAWYRWDIPIPKHCDLLYILPHFQEKCNGFSWFYRNSAMTDGKSSISFSISSSVVSWQREMRIEPSMRSGAMPIASKT